MENNEVYREEQKTALMGLLFEIPSFAILLFSAIRSGSTLVWLDVIDSFVYCLQIGFVVFLSYRLRKNLKYKYNYGIARTETIAALFCDLLMVLGLICITATSVYELFRPVKPSEVLLYVILLKIVECGFDTFLVVKQRRIRKNSNSAVVDTEYAGAVKDLAFDIISLVLVAVCFLFRDYRFSGYFSSAAALACSIAFLIQRFGSMKQKAGELCDETLNEEAQLKVLTCLNRHNGAYNALYAINSHKLEEVYYIDFHLGFPPGTRYDEIEDLSRVLCAELNEILGDCRVSVIISDNK